MAYLEILTLAGGHVKKGLWSLVAVIWHCLPVRDAHPEMKPMEGLNICHSEWNPVPEQRKLLLLNKFSETYILNLST